MINFSYHNNSGHAAEKCSDTVGKMRMQRILLSACTEESESFGDTPRGMPQHRVKELPLVERAI